MCSNVCVGGRLKIYHFKGHLDLTRVKVFNMSLEDVEKMTAENASHRIRTKKGHIFIGRIKLAQN